MNGQFNSFIQENKEFKKYSLKGSLSQRSKDIMECYRPHNFVINKPSEFYGCSVITLLMDLVLSFMGKSQFD